VSATIPANTVQTGQQKIWIRGRDAAGNWGPALALDVQVNGQMIVGVGDQPVAFSLWQNAPNPTSGPTQIAFGLPTAGPVELAIFDLQGRQVKSLAQGTFDAGVHYVRWDGRDDGGQQVSSGVYWYRYSDGRQAAQKRMVVVRYSKHRGHLRVEEAAGVLPRPSSTTQRSSVVRVAAAYTVRPPYSMRAPPRWSYGSPTTTALESRTPAVVSLTKYNPLATCFPPSLVAFQMALNSPLSDDNSRIDLTRRPRRSKTPRSTVAGPQLLSGWIVPVRLALITETTFGRSKLAG
jgi:hypothetical protein